MSYITDTNVSVRVSVNPFSWDWKPFFVYERPSPTFPKRKTIGFGWLMFQFFIDIDNGEVDMSMFKRMPWHEDAIDE